jgi:hypothetical protein
VCARRLRIVSQGRSRESGTAHATRLRRRPARTLPLRGVLLRARLHNRVHHPVGFVYRVGSA